MLHTLMCFSGTIVKRAKPLVPGHLQIAVVYSKVPMVKLMVKCSQRKSFRILYEQIFETCMGLGRRERLVLHVKKDMQWMSRHQKVN